MSGSLGRSPPQVGRTWTVIVTSQLQLLWSVFHKCALRIICGHGKFGVVVLAVTVADGWSMDKRGLGRGSFVSYKLGECMLQMGALMDCEGLTWFVVDAKACKLGAAQVVLT